MIKMNEANEIKIMEFNKEDQSIEILGHKIDKSYESWKAFLEEIKRLTLTQNNWNELKKYISAEWYCFDKSVEFEVAKNILNKMQELESDVK